MSNYDVTIDDVDRVSVDMSADTTYSNHDPNNRYARDIYIVILCPGVGGGGGGGEIPYKRDGGDRRTF